MIKQFNFYDIYGYLLPGTLLLAIFWLPVAVLTRTWPDQDVSKAVFLVALAYVLGLLVQSVAIRVTPSKVRDGQGHLRLPSDLFLDPADDTFTAAFKGHLAEQIRGLFGLSVSPSQAGTGDNSVSSDRKTAFLQARSCLIAKKAASYAEQFEGLYAMMRGLGCVLCAGAAYLAGWAVTLPQAPAPLPALKTALSAAVLGAVLLSAWWPRRTGGSDVVWVRRLLRALMQDPPWRAALWLLLLFCAGFWASILEAPGSLQQAPVDPALILWASAALLLIAAGKCFSSYRQFAEDFAATVWRDFSACLSYQETPGQTADGAQPGPLDASEPS